MKSTLRAHRPLTMGIKIVLTIVIIELTIILALRSLDAEHTLPPYVPALIDVIVLSIASSVVIMYFYVKPMKIIDEHLQLSAALHESEAHNLALLNAIPDMMFRIHRDGTYLDVRTSHEEDLLIPSEKIIGSNIRNAFPGELAEELLHTIEQVLETNETEQIEYSVPIRNILRYFEARIVKCASDEVITIVRDITETKWASEALVKAENRFRLVVENLGEGIIITDPDDVVLYANKRMTEMSGFSNDELMGKPAYQTLLHPEDWPIIRERNRQRMEGISGQYTKRSFRKDGTPFWAEVNATPYRNVSGKIIGTLAALTDITERKRSELLQSALYRIANETINSDNTQDLFQSIHKIISELMYAKNFYIALHDSSTNILSFPYFVDEIDEPPPARVLKKGLTEYVLRVGETVHASPERFQELVNTGEVEEMGEPSIDWLGIPLQSGGQTFGVLAVQSYNSAIVFSEHEKEILSYVAQSISQAIYRKAEQELFRAVWENSSDGMRLTDQNGTVILINSAYCNLVKLSQKQLLGQDLAFYQQEEFRDRDLQVYAERFQGKQNLSHISEVLHLWNGEDIPVDISTSFFTSSTNETLLLSIFRDVSEQKNLQAQLFHSQKMESIGVLAGGIAHDFNNVLAMILSSAEMLHSKMSDDKNLQRYLSIVISSAERGAGITRQLLMFARSEKGSMKPLSLSHIVLEVNDLLQHSLPKSIATTVIVRDTNDTVIGDSDQLHQVILNLAINSNDAIGSKNDGSIVFEIFTHTGDEVRIRFPHATEEKYVVLSVTDNGDGIDEQTRLRMFEPFFSTKERGKGTGLGLSIVHGVISEHEGLIDVQSTVGVGTTMLLYIPYHHHEILTPPLDSTEHSVPNNMMHTILLVEDEVNLRTMLSDFLTESGYSVRAASDGVEALEVFTEHKETTALIISDLGMPRMGGIELLQKLKELKSDVKVIFTTGYLEHKSKSELLKCGVKDVFLKPYNLHNVLFSIRKVLAL